MWNIIKEYRHYIVAALIVLMPMIALNSGTKEPASLYWFDRLALRLTAPAQSILTWGINNTWESIENYFFLLNVRKYNVELLSQNRQLMNELASFREVALENERLRKLVSFSQAIAGKKVTAKVIAQDLLPEFRTLRLNKGEKDGVARGMAVVTHEGIVGRIIRVDKNYSDVLTLLDSSSNVAGLVQRNRTRGVVEGFTENLLRMKHVRRTDDIRNGDVIISSGIGTLFPKGLVVGKVVSVRKKKHGITQTVEIYPSVDFSRLEEVIVIKPAASVDVGPRLETSRLPVDETKK